MRGASGVVDGGFEYFEKYGSLRRIRCSEICACFCPTFDHQLRRDCLNAEGIWGAGGGREVSVDTEGDEGTEEGEQEEERMANASLEDRKGRIVLKGVVTEQERCFYCAVPRIRHSARGNVNRPATAVVPSGLVTILNISRHVQRYWLDNSPWKVGVYCV